MTPIDGSVSETPARPIPRRGRFWILLVLGLAFFALGYLVVNISTQKANHHVVKVEGVETAQSLFGGVPQEGARLGSSDAPVTIQVFDDIQSSECRAAFLAVIPALTEKYGRDAGAKLIYHHYSNSENDIERGFFGAEAAAEQGYGWQYIYLFFRNQGEAERFGVGEEEARRNGLKETFIASIAGGIEELNPPEWEQALEEGEETDSPIAARLTADEELGSRLGIRYGQALVINGPRGTETLQENAGLPEVEKAIAKVE